MVEGKAGPFYGSSDIPVRVGDRVSIDLHLGTVCGVYSPGSQEAADCYCEDTGAISLTFDDGVPVVIPFGNRHEIVKIS